MPLPPQTNWTSPTNPNNQDWKENAALEATRKVYNRAIRYNEVNFPYNGLDYSLALPKTTNWND